MNIFVANLNFNSIESDVQRLFAPFGEIDSVIILRDKWNNRSKGAAIIEMPILKQAENAITNLHKSLFAGKVISVTSTSYEEGYR
jgi:RNA recognition motif-containing protein